MNEHPQVDRKAARSKALSSHYAKYKADPVNAEKLQARRQCVEAIRDGRLVRQPCEKCGDSASQAHHEDYAQPLSVNWLCRRCHAHLHRKSHCVHGHPLTPENVAVDKTGRHCKICNKNRTYARRRAVVKSSLGGRYEANI